MNKYGLTLFVIFFAAGLTASEILMFPAGLLLPLSGISILSASIAFVSKSIPNSLATSMLYISIILGGMSYMAVRYNQEPQIAIFSNSKCLVYGTIYENSLPEKERMNFNISTDSLLFPGEIMRKKFNLSVFMYMEDSLSNPYTAAEKLFPGRKVIIKGKIKMPEAPSNPAEPDFRNYYKMKNLTGTISFNFPEDIVIDERSSDSKSEFFYDLRISLDKRIHKLFPAETASLLRGLLLGERNDIHRNDLESFRKAGIIHILAVSGLHVGFIILVLGVITGRLPLKYRIIAIIAGIIFYSNLTGNNTPVVRASVMSITLLLSVLINRKYFGIHALASAALIILLIEPLELFSPGFQFSFAAVTGIILFYKPVSKSLSKILKNKFLIKITGLLLLTIIAQLSVFPLVLYYYYNFPILSVLSNLVAVPLTALTIFTAFSGILASYLYLPAASAFAIVTDLYSGWLFMFADYMKTTGPQMNIRFSLGQVFLFYFIFVSCITLIKTASNIRYSSILAVLVILNLLVFTGLNRNSFIQRGKLNIIALATGNSDAYLIIFPNGKSALVDTGRKYQSYNSGEKIIAPLLSYLEIDTLNYIFLSHIDIDHYGGLEYLVSNRKTGTVYKPSYTGNPEEIALEKHIRGSGAELEYYYAGSLDVANCRLYFLNFNASNEKADNNNSGVIRLEYGNTSFLFTGDIDTLAEEKLKNIYGEFLQSSVLKVSHHGSKSSSGYSFLETVNPSYAVITCGENNYGHPSPEVLERLSTKKIKFYRTDISGAVIFCSDGKELKITEWKNNGY